MAQQKKTAVQKIQAILKRGPKRGLTINDVATRAGVHVITAGDTLRKLVGEKQALVIGTKKHDTGKGRPANLYVAR